VDKHRILFVDSGFGYGGSTAFLYSFLNELNRTKFEPVVVYYFNAKGQLINQIRSLGIEVINLKMKAEQRQDYSLAGSIASPQKVSEVLKLKKYSRTVFEFIALDMKAALILADVFRIKKIELLVLNNDLHFHLPSLIASQIAGIPCLCRKAAIGGGRKIKKIFGRLVDMSAAISIATAEDYLKSGMPPQRLVTIYEGIDLKKYHPRPQNDCIREKFNIPSKAKVVGYISRLAAGKGHSDFVKAASCVLKKKQDVFFLITGEDLQFEGILRRELEQQVRNLRVEKNVILTGWRKDLLDVFSAIDVFAHCPNTWNEGLGIATLEAMAMGKPMVVTANGGLKETTIDGVTGFVVPIGDVGAIAQAILKLVNDPQMMRQMGREARLRAEQKFNIEDNVRKMEELFEFMLDQHKNHGRQYGVFYGTRHPKLLV
jgi:glycosyltransferase involved in cell wall biosynthesis